MKIVITGPTGAIGHALIEEAISHGDSILAICHRGSQRIKSLPQSENVKVLELNADEYASFADEYDAKESYDVFFHFAWSGTTGDSRNDTLLQCENVKNSIDAVKLADKMGCKTFIGAGSQAEYGRVEGMLSPNTPTFPENGYGIAKLCAGKLTKIECEKRNIRHIWTRILSIYGPYDGENSMIISSLRKMAAGEKTEFTAGEQKWDYLYSGDAGRAMRLLALRGISGKVYTIGSGRVRLLKEYINIMAEKMECVQTINLGAIPYSDKQVMFLCADISELEADTGFKPTVEFESGIVNTIEYVLNQGKN